MSTRMSRTESVGDNLCPVCHDVCEIFAFGACDHPICYRCSTRMRVLCTQVYCPICRGDLPQIVFLTCKQKYEEVDRRNCIPNRKFKILLEDESVEDAFNALLEHHCKVCDKIVTFDTFLELQRHVARTHQLFPCKLCVDHLKLFPFERKFYTRKDLAGHCKHGDTDNTSYRGHPQCDFCNERYMDKDELLRHLRKSHYYCHFCDASNTNEYFNEYSDLKQHFRNHHFLCQEGDCGHTGTQFTHAFNSEIDLKAHVANDHVGNKSKAQVRELRTIDVNFQMAPRRRGRDAGIVAPEDFEEVNYGSRDRRRRRYDNQQDASSHQEHRTPITAEPASAPIPPPPVLEVDFPSLGNAPPPFVPRPTQPAKHEEQFPSLAAQRQAGPNVKLQPSLLSKTSSSVVKSMTGNGPRLANNRQENTFSTTAAVVTNADAGRLSGTSSRPTQASSMPVRPFTAAVGRPLAADDFPSLSNGKTSKASSDNSVLVSSGAWSKSQKDGETSKPSAKKGKASKSLGTPQSLAALGRSLCDDGEFPTLGGGAAPHQSGWVKKNTKETKSKNNASSAPLGNVRNKSAENKNSTVKQDSETGKVAGPKSVEAKLKEDCETGKVPGPKSVEAKLKKKKKKEKAREETIAIGDSGISLSSIASEIDDLVDDLVAEEKPSLPLVTVDKEDTQVLRTCTDNGVLPSPSEVVPLLEKASSTEEKENKDWETVEPRKSSAKPFKDDDFPTLQALPKKSVPPPGFQKPCKATAPPGLSKPRTVLSWGRPPPGLSASLPSPPSAGSSGEASSNCTSFPASAMHAYISPFDSAERNRILVHNVRQLLDVKSGGFEKFRAISGEFRGGQMTATGYYKQCQDLFGHNRLLEVLPELVALLPDIGKQHLLLEAHNKDILGLCAPLSLSTCSSCQQLLKPEDLLAHIAAHTTSLRSQVAVSSFSVPIKT